MPRRGEMSDQDAADELIRQNVSYYNVVLHIPQHNSRVYFSSNDLNECVEFAETVFDNVNLPQVRAAMIYAVDEQARFALVGTANQFEKKFKPNVVKIY